MRAVVGVTDNQWAAFLRDRPELREANFWLPSGMRFGALHTGEPFLFKTHWPENQLVGGGFLSGYTQLRTSEAWDFFGPGNGVASYDELLTRIHHYRRNHRLEDRDPDPIIGCILLRDIFFAPRGQELPGPPDFGKPIVTWKKYDLEADAGRYVANAVASLSTRARVDLTWADDLGPSIIGGPTRGLPRLVVPRLGQQAFRGLVLTSYDRHCAITGNRITPVLESAHIRPVSQGGEHRLDNGLLLRSDVHRLYDDGYLGIDEHHRLHVSPRLQQDFGNGQEFYDRAGTRVQVPSRRADRPNAAAVTWHMDTVFQR